VRNRGDMFEPTLVVLAAGIGSRYGGLKQIDPVGPSGEIILEYSIYDALNAGFGRVVFVISEAIEAVFRESVGRRIEKQCETAYVFQRLENLPEGFTLPRDRIKPWGTGHATLACRNAVDAPFAVINADDFYGRAAYRALGDYLRKAQDRDGLCDFCMVGYSLENTLSEHGHVTRGVCTVSEDGHLVEIHERMRIERSGQVARYTEDGKTWVELPRGTTVSMNIWGFTPSLFAELGIRFPQFLEKNSNNMQQAEFLLPVAVGELIKARRATVRVLSANARWFGVTYQEDKPRVKQAIQELIRRGTYPENLWEEAR
jgi:NDP-sugar pyrophosphorylase family protein